MLVTTFIPYLIPSEFISKHHSDDTQHARLSLHVWLQKMIFPLLLCIDQYLKYLSLHHAFNTTHYLFFNLTLAKNTGVTLGFLGNTSWVFIISLQIGLLIWITYLKPPHYIRTLIFAGATSNIIDRLYYGFVIDYIHFQIGSWQWPAIVNLADIYITLAVFLWFLKKTVR